MVANIDHRSPAERRRVVSWAQRLKRVFNIDAATRVHCAGAVRIVASIEEPAAINAILAHFEKHAAPMRGTPLSREPTRRRPIPSPNYPNRHMHDGSRVVLHDVRNFDWRSEDNYSVRGGTRAYDLDHLVSADLILSYWMGPHIAHTLVSFGFDDGRQLVLSLEIRKERDEAFSTIGGFFREFETVLIAADENDIVRTRTNARGEDVYLYPRRPLQLPPPVAGSKSPT